MVGARGIEIPLKLYPRARVEPEGQLGAGFPQATVGVGRKAPDHEWRPELWTYFDYASGNVLYYPAENLMVGAELMWGERTNNDDASEDNVRFQFTVKYNFGITL